MLPDYLRNVAARQAERLAIIDGDQRITYAELIERIGVARQWLREELDPQPGDVIAASIDNSWQFAACFFAAAELGCILMLCNPQWRAAELRPLAQRLQFRGAIIEPRLRDEWSQMPDLIPANRLLSAQMAPARPNGVISAPPAGVGEDAPVAHIATSGSTGTPRLVPRTHRNLIANPESLRGTLNFNPGRRFLAVVPFHYAYGLLNSLLVPLLTGATVVTMARFSPGACAELLHRAQVDTLFGSPFIWGALVDHPHDSPLSSLQLCCTAGGRTPSGVIDRWHKRFGVKIRQTYGMSETGVIATERSELPSSPSPGMCVGEPVVGADVAVLGDSGVKLSAGETGELAVRSAGVMSGYFGEPEWSRTRFHDGYFRTGDLGYLDSEGKLYLSGRMSRVMNISGVKVDPVEVERAIETLLGVASCHVDTVPNGRGGDVIRARVVPREGFQITRRDVIEECRRHLAEYKFPRVIEFLEESPVTLAGKIKRGAPVAG
jgi:acyl-CoA synthetase (AMP-forming)/AMP-acid ligase II